MYVDVESAMEAKLYMSILGGTADKRAFNIRVSQLQSNVAPMGCLQYYQDDVGTIETFNYVDAAEIVQTRVPSYFVSVPFLG